MQKINRRHFMNQCLTAAATAAVFSTPRSPAADTIAAPPLCVFSKHLQFLDFPALAKTCRELGLDGVDLTVRQGGHVRPEQVARELPEAVDAIRAEGLEVPMITTQFKSGGDEHLHQVLETARQCGITYFRVGGHQYTTGRPVTEQIAAFTEEIRGLVSEAEETGLVAGYHNHSGKTISARPSGICTVCTKPTARATWARILMWAMPPWRARTRLGNYGTADGALVRMMAVKDFVFSGNTPAGCPWARGCRYSGVPRHFPEQAGFAGPVSLHFEYKIRDHDHMLDEVVEAVAYMRKEVIQGGLAMA